MASRTLPPLRAASNCLRRIQQAPPAPSAALSLSMPSSRRGVATGTKPRFYAQPTTSSAPAPGSGSGSSSTAASASKTTPKPAGAAAPADQAGTPVPPASGQPLPDAEETLANEDAIDWTQSFHGLGTSSFGPEVAAVLQTPLNPDDIEIKPDGIIYLPEIKYRRILNAAFGPGGWGLAPRGQLTVHERLVTREYALIVQGRFVAQARGEMQYFNEEGISTAAEGCKSNALMRCCKDLGIASELWDPRFIRRFTKEHALQVWVEHIPTKKRKQHWMRKDDEIRYPYKKTSY